MTDVQLFLYKPLNGKNNHAVQFRQWSGFWTNRHITIVHTSMQMREKRETDPRPPYSDRKTSGKWAIPLRPIHKSEFGHHGACRAARNPTHNLQRMIALQNSSDKLALHASKAVRLIVQPQKLNCSPVSCLSAACTGHTLLDPSNLEPAALLPKPVPSGEVFSPEARKVGLTPNVAQSAL